MTDTPRVTPTERRVILASTALRGTGRVAFDFLHSTLCQSGLPHRNPGDDARSWERQEGNTVLSVEAGKVIDRATHQYHPVGLPFGEKARLVLIYLTTEALRTGTPTVDVEGSLTAFVREIGLHAKGSNILAVKDQLTRLSAATVRLAYFGDEEAAQVNSQLVSTLQLWAPRNHGQRVPWPMEVTLSADYFASLRRHAVPLARPALRALAHSSLALDVYCWLAQRLHRVRLRHPQALSWAVLQRQFGAGYSRERDFRPEFRGVLRKVLAVYPAARVDEDDEGFILHRSPPPIAPRIVALGSVPTPS